MAELHIINPVGGGSCVFKGMFGTITPHGENSVMFQPDPAVAQCTASVQAFVRGQGFLLNKDEVVSIRADEEVINAIKANVARALGRQWENGYDLIERNPQRFLFNASALNVSSTMLGQVIASEREVAAQGIDALINNIPGTSPYWVKARMSGVYIETAQDITADGEVVNSRLALTGRGVRFDFAPATEQAPLTPVSSWIEPMSELEPTNQAFVQEDSQEPRQGYFDVDVRLPIYLPRQASPEQLASTLDLIQTTPLLKAMIIDEPPKNVTADFLSSTPSLVHDYGDIELAGHVDDDYEDDDEDAEGFGNRFDRPEM